MCATMVCGWQQCLTSVVLVTLTAFVFRDCILNDEHTWLWDDDKNFNEVLDKVSARVHY